MTTAPLRKYRSGAVDFYAFTEWEPGRNWENNLTPGQTEEAVSQVSDSIDRQILFHIIATNPPRVLNPRRVRACNPTSFGSIVRYYHF